MRDSLNPSSNWSVNQSRRQQLRVQAGSLELQLRVRVRVMCAESTGWIPRAAAEAEAEAEDEAHDSS